MKNTADNKNIVAFEPYLYLLLHRCSLIEERPIDELLNSILTPYLDKYSYDTLEQWEEVKEKKERERVLQDFEINDNFNPNEIPFNTQILGLRRKLDDLEREIHSNQNPRPDLEQLKFTLLEDLNYAEKEALQKHQDERLALCKKWKSVCAEIPLSRVEK